MSRRMATESEQNKVYTKVQSFISQGHAKTRYKMDTDNWHNWHQQGEIEMQDKF